MKGYYPRPEANAETFAYGWYWCGEEVGAYVQREPGSELTEESVLAACRQKLQPAKAPKVVVFGDDVPVTSTGKYQRGRLRPHFQAFKSVQFRG